MSKSPELTAKLNTPYDPNTHDLARIGFVSVREDWYYIDNETLFES